MITVNKHTKLWDISCDSCSHETLEVEADDFKDAVRVIKSKGWNVFQEDGEWMHTCLECGLSR